MNEMQYMKKQLENELEFYKKSLELLESIEISFSNERAAEVVQLIWKNKRLVQEKLGKGGAV